MILTTVVRMIVSKKKKKRVTIPVSKVHMQPTQHALGGRWRTNTGLISFICEKHSHRNQSEDSAHLNVNTSSSCEPSQHVTTSTVHSEWSVFGGWIQTDHRKLICLINFFFFSTKLLIFTAWVIIHRPEWEVIYATCCSGLDGSRWEIKELVFSLSLCCVHWTSVPLERRRRWWAAVKNTPHAGSGLLLHNPSVNLP